MILFRYLLIVLRFFLRIFGLLSVSETIENECFHVVIVSEEYPPETGWGGIGTYSFHLAKLLTLQGCQVDVLAGSLGGNQVQEKDGVMIHRLSDEDAKGFTAFGLKLIKLLDKKWPYFYQKVRFAWLVRSKVKALMEQKDIHLIEAPEFDGSAFFLPFSCRVPLVVKLHTPIELNLKLNELPFTTEYRLVSLMEKMSVLFADLVTSPSYKMAQFAKETWLPEIKTEIKVIANPIDLDSIEARVLSSAEKSIVYLGRLEKRKGVHLLVEAAFQLFNQGKKVNVTFIGHDTPTFHIGEEVVFFEKYLASQNYPKAFLGTLHFYGRLEKAAIYEQLRRHQLCVLPSISFENFPYTCLEVLSVGLPTVVTDSGGMSEIVKNGISGFVVAPGSVEDLSNCINKYFSRELSFDPNSPREVVRDTCSYEVVAGKLMPVYRELIFNYHHVPQFKSDDLSFTVVCCTNGKKPEKLRRAVESFISLKGPVSEILVLDQSESDVVYDVLYPFASEQIHHYKLKPKGLSAARNFAIEYCRTSIIAFTDDDCVVDENWIFYLSQHFQNNPFLGGIYGQVLPFGEGSEGSFCHSVIDKKERSIFAKPIIPYARLGHGNNMAFHRDVFKTVGLYNELLGAGAKFQGGEDTDMTYRMLRHKVALAYCPDCLVYHDNWMPMKDALEMDYKYVTSSVLVFVKHLLQFEVNALEYLSGRLNEIRQDLGFARERKDFQRVASEKFKLKRYLMGIPLGMIFALASEKKYDKS